jgi:hypothetical protein
MRVVSVAVLLLLGCGERPASTEAASPTSSSAPLASARPALAQRTRAMPAPTPMPGGGARIDLRGTVRHVRTLERQPDGKYRQACVAPSAASSSDGTK